jgi:hypothetical protein
MRRNNNGQHEENDERARDLVSLRRRAEEFNAVLDQYGPRPKSNEELQTLLVKEMPRYALYMVCCFGFGAGLIGLGIGLLTHAGIGMAWLCGFWGVVTGLVVRNRRWAQAYLFGTTMFAARGLLPWEALWNGVKHYKLAARTMKESFTAIEERAALQKALGESTTKPNWWKRGVRIEKKL